MLPSRRQWRGYHATFDGISLSWKHAWVRFDQLGDPLGHEDPDKDDPLRLWVLVEVDKDDR